MDEKDIVLSIRNISYYYKKNRTIFNGLNFDIKEGDVVGVLGHNGAGKTTLFKLILDIYKCKSGIITKKYKKNEISYVPEEGGIYSDLSPVNNLLLRTKINHKEISDSDIDELLERLNLLNRKKDLYVGEWSNGMRKRLAIAGALISKPQMLFLDEPTNGLDPESKKIIVSILKEENKRGTTIMINTHDLQMVSQICNKIIILQNGEIIYMGEVLDSDLEELYFSKVKQYDNE